MKQLNIFLLLKASTMENLCRKGQHKLKFNKKFFPDFLTFIDFIGFITTSASHRVSKCLAVVPQTSKPPMS